MTTRAVELWKPVVGMEHALEVSTQGRVRSLPKTDRIGRTVAPRILQTRLVGPGRKRYVRVRVTIDSTQYDLAVHSLVLKAFVGPRPDGMQGCHNDGDPQNNSIENLRWDTAAGNTLDRVRHGTVPRGEQLGTSILNNQQVAFIKAACASGVRPWVLAKGFGVSRRTVAQIRLGRNWAHVPASEDETLRQHVGAIARAARHLKAARWQQSNPKYTYATKHDVAAAKKALDDVFADAVAWWNQHVNKMKG